MSMPSAGLIHFYLCLSMCAPWVVNEGVNALGGLNSFLPAEVPPTYAETDGVSMPSAGLIHFYTLFG